MGYQVTCPACGKVGTRSTPPEPGKNIRCPACRNVFSTPGIEVSDPGPSVFVPIDTSPRPIVLTDPQPLRRKSAIALLAGRMVRTRLPLVCYGLGLLSMWIVWALWPTPESDRIIVGTSPEYMLASIDAQAFPLSKGSRIEIYKFVLDKSQDYYKENQRYIAYMTCVTAADMNRDGCPTDIFMLLTSAVDCAIKARERDLPTVKKYSFREFLNIYSFFRRDMKMSHADAIQRLDNLQKL